MLRDALEKLGRSQWHKKAYTWGVYLSYLLFGLALTGILQVNPKYLSRLESGIKYYVCAFLLLRFNPITHKPARSAATAEFDRRIAFSAGLFLLLTTTVTSVVASYVDHAKATVIRGVSGA